MNKIVFDCYLGEGSLKYLDSHSLEGETRFIVVFDPNTQRFTATSEATGESLVFKFSMPFKELAESCLRYPIMEYSIGDDAYSDGQALSEQDVFIHGEYVEVVAVFKKKTLSRSVDVARIMANVKCEIECLMDVAEENESPRRFEYLSELLNDVSNFI